jgi:hypothetical protein
VSNDVKQVSSTAHSYAFENDENTAFYGIGYNFYFYRGGDSFDSYTEDTNFAHLSWGKWVRSRRHVAPNIIKFFCESGYGFYIGKDIAEIIIEKAKGSEKKISMTILDIGNREVIAYVSQDDTSWYLTIYNADKINIDVLIFTVISHRNL